jgi:MFS family permease
MDARMASSSNTMSGNWMRRIAAACIRGLIGAFAGLIVTSVIMLIAVNDFEYGARQPPVVLARSIVRLVVGGMAIGAIVAARSGTKELRGRTGAAIRGMAFGGLAGVLIGPLLLAILCPLADMPVKAAWGIGIFVGLPFGALFGGIVGVALYSAPAKKLGVCQIDDLADSS